MPPVRRGDYNRENEAQGLQRRNSNTTVARQSRGQSTNTTEEIHVSHINPIDTMSRVMVICALVSSAAIAQSDYGSIGGFAKDPSGAVVPKAKVVVTNEATREAHPVSTNDSGYYTVPNLPPGGYSMTAEAAGFKKFESKHNILNANSALSLDATFVVGAATETVEVVATAAVLQTESGSVSGEIPGSQLQAQELNGRNPVYMAQLLPGVRGGATMARLLLSLSQGKAKGLAETTQVMYATHCPLFVGIDRFDDVRIVTKSIREGDKPRFSEISFKTLEDI